MLKQLLWCSHVNEWVFWWGFKNKTLSIFALFPCSLWNIIFLFNLLLSLASLLNVSPNQIPTSWSEMEDKVGMNMEIITMKNQCSSQTPCSWPMYPIPRHQEYGYWQLNSYFLHGHREAVCSRLHLVPESGHGWWKSI